MSKHWSKEDDATLASLFKKGKKNGGFSVTDTSKEHISECAKQHWPERSQGKKLDSFIRLYRKKARIFRVAKTLTGSRKGECFGLDCSLVVQISH